MPVASPPPGSGLGPVATLPSEEDEVLAKDTRSQLTAGRGTSQLFRYAAQFGPADVALKRIAGECVHEVNALGDLVAGKDSAQQAPHCGVVERPGRADDEAQEA
jgi:hypothetical protein